MRRSTLCLSLLLGLFCASVCASVCAEDEKKGWIQLFNGKDLSGWKVKIRGYELGENFGNTFRVVDGHLAVGYEKYDSFDARFGHIFHERKFSNYILRAEYRFVGDQAKGGPGWAFRNSGLMIHGQTPESMSKDQDFPASIEVQLLGGRGDGSKRTTSKLCTPGTDVVMGGKLFLPHRTISRSKTYHGDQWVTAIVEVRGNSIIHRIEGEEFPVLDYTDPQLDERDGSAKKLLAAGHPKMLTKGTISLQSESHPVEFRKVEILPLSDAKWSEPLAVDDLSKAWHTKGNWTLLLVELNGVLVNRVRLDEGRIKDRPASGKIGFQDHALRLDLRNLRIRRL